MAAVGILGGTFNPPHVGHLVMASEAAAQLGLDHVVLMPVHTPPHKEVVGDPGPEVRAGLCELAVAGDDRFSVSRLEVERGGPSYTVATLGEIHATRPGDQLTFIVGGDVAAGLASWREPEALAGLARLAVAERAEVRRTEIAERIGSLVPLSRLAFFDMPRMDISSSEIRRRVAAGRPIRYLVPDRVAEAIATQSLYTPAGGTTTA